MTTHIIGPDVFIGGRWLRQRCSWCGVVLLNDDLTQASAPPGMIGAPPVFPVGEVVRVEGENPTTFSVLAHLSGENLPDDSCVTVELDAMETARMDRAMEP